MLESEIIGLLNDILIELDARECSNNCIIPYLQDVPWVDLCDKGIELFEKLKRGTTDES